MQIRNTMKNRPYTQLDDDEPLLPLAAIWSLAWRHKLVIALSVVVCVMLAGIYLAFASPTYTATASVLVDPRKANVTDASDVLPGYGTDSAAVSSQVGILGSSKLLRGVFEREKIMQDPEFTRSGLLGRLLGGGKAPTESAVYETFRKHVDVSRRGVTYVIDVSFSSMDAEKAARIANAIVAAYLNGQVTEKSQANTEVNTQLDTKIAALKKSVTQAEEKVADFKAEHGIVETGSGGTLLQVQLEQVSEQLIAVRAAARAAQNTLDLAERNASLGVEQASKTIETDAALQLRENLNTLEAQQSSLSATLGARHPRMVTLSAEIARIRNQLGAEVRRDIEQKRVVAQRADQQVKAMQRDLDDLRAKIDAANQQEVQLRQLKRQADAARAVLEDFQHRAEEVGQLSSLQLPDARVITSADVPSKPVWPRPKVILPVAALFGGLLGTALVFLTNNPAAVRQKEEASEMAAEEQPEPAESRIAAMARGVAEKEREPVEAAPVAPALSTETAPAVPRKTIELGKLEAEGMYASPADREAALTQIMQAITRHLGSARPPYLLTFSSRTRKVGPAALSQALATVLEEAGIDVVAVDLDHRSDVPSGEDLKRLAAEFADRADFIFVTVSDASALPSASHLHILAADENAPVRDMTSGGDGSVPPLGVVRMSARWPGRTFDALKDPAFTRIPQRALDHA